LVDRGALAVIGTEAVAHGILHFERSELEARERAARGRDVDAQRPRDGEVPPPIDPFGERVELVRVAIAAVRDLPQDAARDPRLEVVVVGKLARTRAADAPLRRRDG